MRRQEPPLGGTMNWIIRLARPLIKRIIKNELDKAANKKMLVDLVNSKVNLPKMDEKEEEALFIKLYEALQDSLDKIVDKL